MPKTSGFIKTASVRTIAVATVEDDGFKHSAAYEDNKQSAFLSSNRPIDIKAALSMVAKEYDVSPNPEDYVFEAIRGNTSNVPNENNDGFHKTELLRFDHRLGKQVYRTYELKPHHVNHRADNPKNARGFILDAHYNDSAASLAECPECGTKTAEKGNRDPETGIHCANCGTVVKDEFVELLVAIDTKKDPTFANGVINGVLKHGSMGCSCLRTRCNVCNNVAYTRNEFCAHIRNKGKEYDESEKGFNPIAYTIRHSKKIAGRPTKIAKAFEWCEGTIFDEYSRVHDPADPKAEQYEILKLSERVAAMETSDNLRNESDILMLQAKIADLEKKIEEKISISKHAQAAPPVPPSLPSPPPGVAPTAPGAPSPISVQEGKDGRVVINISTTGAEPGVGLSSTSPIEEVPPAPGSPEAGMPIEEMTPEAIGATPAPPGGVLTPAAMGIMPPAAPGRGASAKQSQNLGGPSMLRFAQSYKNLKAEITTTGNIRIFDGDGTYFVVKPDKVPSDGKVANKDGKELAKTVLTMIAEHGIGGTIRRTNAIMGPRISQVLEYAVNDMAGEERIKTDSILEEEDNDTQEAKTQEAKSVTDEGQEVDSKEPHETKGIGDSALTGRETDVEDEQHDVESPASLLQGGGGSVKHPESDTREKRKDWDLGKGSVEGIALDHVEQFTKSKKGENANKVHAARLEGIYKTRLEKKVSELEKEKEDYKNNLRDRLIKAMKIAARRQALNLEYSPIKTSMGVALCNKRSLGEGYEYEPMDQKTAVHLIEAAFNEPLVNGTDKPAWESFIDGLVERAASIMKMNDEALMQIEADLKNINVVSVPLDDSVVMNPNTDDNLKTAVKNGNLQLAPSSRESALEMGNDRRSSIRRAVGTTRVASLANVSR